MSQQIKVGSLVRLKSDAVPRTVVEISEANGHQIATCVWLNKQDREETGTYPFDALVLVEGNKLSPVR
ncbi:MAG: hypothetical protein JO328_09105 [Hyphomicrobiales bacterium]|nr:hypothetical protein [Hyphomicrobiales bacterium]MBV8824382.1 hypothetical protein [Hyphomicrobiales bacterium]MBV9428753.1 hypothetical protein [Bradyrhizobiaceae bacterium]